MIIRFVFDVEAEDLHKEGFSYGYVVARVNPVTNEFVVLEQGECHSLEGANRACDWVKQNVIPCIPALLPYVNVDLESLDPNSLPDTVVRTNREMRERFYSIYMKYKKMNAEFWSDVNFPVETNFLSAIVKDGNGSRDFEMPYPLYDLANFLEVGINRIAYCDLPELQAHNPLSDATTILYALQKIENELRASKQKLPAISSEQSKLRFVFDVGAQDLQLSAFSFGYVVTQMDDGELKILEKGRFYSIYSAQDAKDYVRENTLPCLKILTPYMCMDKNALENEKLPTELVLTAKELREKFYSIYGQWRSAGAQIYSSDVNFPVETNFLSTVVEDGKGDRDWEMPYPLIDISSVLDVNISREQYTGLGDLIKGDPLHHAIASSCALYMYEAKKISQDDTLENKLTYVRRVFQEGLKPDEPKYDYAMMLQKTGSPIICNSKSSEQSAELGFTGNDGLSNSL